MRIALTPEQLELRSMLREVFSDHCPPTVVRAMKEPLSDGVPAGLWTVLARSGLLGLAVDPEYGGEGAGLFELGLLFAEAGRALCPTVVYSTLRFGVALSRLGSPEQRKAHLPALAAGELKASTALSDPSDTGDLAPRLVAARAGSGSGWSLSGTLMFVPNAATAELILVTAADPDGVTHGFLVRPGLSGAATEPLRTIAGDKQSTLTLAAHPVAEEDALGPLDPDDLRWAANAGLALQCMEMVGGADAVLDTTVDYINTRQQFGRTIGSFQAAQHHVANMRIALDAARLASWQAVWRIGTGVTGTREVAIAKMAAGEAYKNNTLTAHQLHGGIGFVRETDLHLWSERAKVTEVQGGTADTAARWLQREIGLLA